MMKQSLIIVAVMLSIAVSFGLILSIDRPQIIIEPIVETSTIQEPTPEPKAEQKGLYTKADLITNPHLYDLDDAWNIMRVEYNDATQTCWDEFSDDLVSLNPCLTSVNSRWLEIEAILERNFE